MTSTGMGIRSWGFCSNWWREGVMNDTIRWIEVEAYIATEEAADECI